MKKPVTSKTPSMVREDLLAEYNFDYRKAKPNRFADRKEDRRDHMLNHGLNPPLLGTDMGYFQNESYDNLPMFCCNLPISSPVEILRNHPAFIRCAGIIIRNALEL
jgi:hypothetical protein